MARHVIIINVILQARLLHRSLNCKLLLANYKTEKYVTKLAGASLATKRDVCLYLELHFRLKLKLLKSALFFTTVSPMYGKREQT